MMNYAMMKEKMKHKKKIISFVALSLAAGASYAHITIPKSDDLIYNRYWVDSMPESETDLMNLLAFVKQDDGAGLAVNLKQSQWHKTQDLFVWETEQGSDFVFYFFPQYDKSGELSFSAKECDAPEPFELCLQIESSDPKLFPTKTYYSRYDFEIENDAIETKDLNEHMLETFVQQDICNLLHNH